MKQFFDFEADVNGWRVLNMVCLVLLDVWLVIALPYITMDFGGLGGVITRFTSDQQDHVQGLELYRHIILMPAMTEEYIVAMPLVAFPAGIVLLVGTYAFLRSQHRTYVF